MRRRKNARGDEGLRDLERRATSGDPIAQAAFFGALARSGAVGLQAYAQSLVARGVLRGEFYFADRMEERGGFTFMTYHLQVPNAYWPPTCSACGQPVTGNEGAYDHYEGRAWGEPHDVADPNILYGGVHVEISARSSSRACAARPTPARWYVDGYAEALDVNRTQLSLGSRPPAPSGDNRTFSDPYTATAWALSILPGVEARVLASAEGAARRENPSRGDAELRRLERLGRQGDEAAWWQYQALRIRMGIPPARYDGEPLSIKGIPNHISSGTVFEITPRFGVAVLRFKAPTLIGKGCPYTAELIDGRWTLRRPLWGSDTIRDATADKAERYAEHEAEHLIESHLRWQNTDWQGWLMRFRSVPWLPGPRVNPPQGDERLRDLERAAAAGDPQARAALVHAWLRIGRDLEVEELEATVRADLEKHQAKIRAPIKDALSVVLGNLAATACRATQSGYSHGSVDLYGEEVTLFVLAVSSEAGVRVHFSILERPVGLGRRPALRAESYERATTAAVVARQQAAAWTRWRETWSAQQRSNPPSEDTPEAMSAALEKDGVPGGVAARMLKKRFGKRAQGAIRERAARDRAWTQGWVPDLTRPEGQASGGWEEGPKRANPPQGDARLRELERAADQGDALAAKELHTERLRSGLPLLPDSTGSGNFLRFFDLPSDLSVAAWTGDGPNVVVFRSTEGHTAAEQRQRWADRSEYDLRWARDRDFLEEAVQWILSEALQGRLADFTRGTGKAMHDLPLRPPSLR